MKKRNLKFSLVCILLCGCISQSETQIEFELKKAVAYEMGCSFENTLFEDLGKRAKGYGAIVANWRKTSCKGRDSQTYECFFFRGPLTSPADYLMCKTENGELRRYSELTPL